MQGVRTQLDRMLASPHFVHSKRYSVLLRYIVEHALEHGDEPPKERTIGFEVFHREPAYDTNADPVVRTTAAQLRRRLAQYYLQPEHSGELVISLPPGGYQPEFRWPAEQDAPSLESVSVRNPDEIPRPKRNAWLALACAAILISTAAAFYSLRPAQPSLQRFWGPVWNSPGTILVSVGIPNRPADTNLQDAANAEPQIRDALRLNAVAWPDAMTTSRVTGILGSHGRAFDLRKSSETSFADLKAGPAVLVGGFNNVWIMRLGANLRFNYQWDGPGAGTIRDTSHPEVKSWRTDFRAPFSTFTRDYGLITRLTEPTTGRVLVIASGIASYGTIAAGDFLTDEKLMEALDQRAPAGWNNRNVQAVFSTTVVNGSAGRPQIIAVHVW